MADRPEPCSAKYAMPISATKLKAVTDQVNPREPRFLDAKSGTVDDETPAE